MGKCTPVPRTRPPEAPWGFVQPAIPPEFMISDEAPTTWVSEVIRRNRSNNRLGSALRVSVRMQCYTYASKWYTSILGLINHSHQLAQLASQLAKLVENEQLGRIEVTCLY